MSARRLSRGRGAVGRPACAHARILLQLLTFLLQLFSFLVFGRFSFWCGGEGTQNFIGLADPSPPINQPENRPENCQNLKIIS